MKTPYDRFPGGMPHGANHGMKMPKGKKSTIINMNPVGFKDNMPIMKRAKPKKVKHI